MQISELDSINKPIEVYNGVYMRRIPMTKMQQYMLKFTKETTQKESENITNSLFKEVLVDSEGNEFDDIKKGKATEILSLDVIKSILDVIFGHVSPGETEKKS